MRGPDARPALIGNTGTNGYPTSSLAVVDSAKINAVPVSPSVAANRQRNVKHWSGGE